MQGMNNMEGKNIAVGPCQAADIVIGPIENKSTGALNGARVETLNRKQWDLAWAWTPSLRPRFIAMASIIERSDFGEERHNCPRPHIHGLGCTESGHYTEAKWLNALFPVVLAVGFFLIGKLDLSRDQPLLVLVAFKLDGFTNLQKLAIHQVGLVHHYIRGTAVFEKPGVLVAEPFFNYCLQKFTSCLIFI